MLRKGKGLKNTDPLKRIPLKRSGKLSPGGGLNKSDRPLSKQGNVLMHRADRVFSLYVRTKASDADGYVQCFTCAAKLPIGEIQLGHYLSRGRYDTRFLEMNTAPQCGLCNTHHGGRPEVFRQRLVEKYGEDQILEMEKPNTNFKITDDYLKNIIKICKI